MIRVARQFGLYLLGVCLTLGVGLFSVPTLIHLQGSVVWAQLAIVQAVAAILSIAIGCGWQATGPAKVALMTPAERPQHFLCSAATRAAVATIALPVGAAISVVVSGLSPGIAALCSIGYALPALGASWYFVGQARPARLLLADTLPRAVAVVVGIYLTSLTGSLLGYALGLTIVGLFGLILTYLIVLREAPVRAVGWADIGQELRAQRHGITTMGTSTVYVNSPLIIAGLVLKTGLPELALAIRIFTYLILGLAPFLQLAQGWVPESGSGLLHQRIRTVTRLTLAGSGIAFVGTATLMPWVGGLLSLGEISIPFSIAVPMGAVVSAVVVSQIVGLACLTAAGAVAVVARSTMIGAALGIPLLLVCGVTLGAPGIALAMAAAEIAVSGYQLASLRALLSRADRQSPALHCNETD